MFLRIKATNSSNEIIISIPFFLNHNLFILCSSLAVLVKSTFEEKKSQANTRKPRLTKYVIKLKAAKHSNTAQTHPETSQETCNIRDIKSDAHTHIIAVKPYKTEHHQIPKDYINQPLAPTTRKTNTQIFTPYKFCSINS